MISIFVSSTFRDMHAERDALHNIVLPEISDFAKRYGETIQFIDLRWGVSTFDSDDRIQKIIEVCAYEADRCNPFFLGIIGDIYGQTLPHDRIKLYLSPDEQADEYAVLSLTHIEVLKGALLSEKPQGMFLFRSIKDKHLLSETERQTYFECDPIKSDLLDSMKNKIRSAIDSTDIVDYSVPIGNPGQNFDMSNFCSKAAALIKKYITKQLGKPAVEESWTDQAERLFDSLVLKNITIYVNVGRYDELLAVFLNDENKTVLHFVGKQGSGKTMLASHLTNKSKEAGFIVIPIFCDSDFHFTQLANIQSYMASRLAKVLKCTDDGNLERLLEVANESDLKILFVFDSIETISPQIDVELFKYIPFLENDKTKYIVFDSPESDFKEYLPICKKMITKNVASFNTDDIKKIMQAFLTAHHREMPLLVIEAIENKPLSRNGRYLELLFYRLLAMDEDDYKNIVARKVTANNESVDVYSHMTDVIKNWPVDMHSAEKQFLQYILKNHNSIFAKEVIGLIAISRNGIRVSDLQAIIEEQTNELWDSASFHSLLYFMQPLIVIDSLGRIKIKNANTKAATIDVLDFSTCKSKVSWIFSRIDALPRDDEVVIQEYIYYANLAGQSYKILEYLPTTVDESDWLKHSYASHKFREAYTAISDILTLDSSGDGIRMIEFILEGISKDFIKYKDALLIFVLLTTTGLFSFQSRRIIGAKTKSILENGIKQHELQGTVVQRWLYMCYEGLYFVADKRESKEEYLAKFFHACQKYYDSLSEKQPVVARDLLMAYSHISDYYSNMNLDYKKAISICEEAMEFCDSVIAIFNSSQEIVNTLYPVKIEFMGTLGTIYAAEAWAWQYQEKEWIEKAIHYFKLAYSESKAYKDDIQWFAQVSWLLQLATMQKANGDEDGWNGTLSETLKLAEVYYRKSGNVEFLDIIGNIYMQSGIRKGISGVDELKKSVEIARITISESLKYGNDEGHLDKLDIILAIRVKQLCDAQFGFDFFPSISKKREKHYDYDKFESIYILSKNLSELIDLHHAISEAIFEERLPSTFPIETTSDELIEYKNFVSNMILCALSIEFVVIEQLLENRDYKKAKEKNDFVWSAWSKYIENENINEEIMVGISKIAIRLFGLIVEKETDETLPISRPLVVVFLQYKELTFLLFGVNEFGDFDKQITRHIDFKLCYGAAKIKVLSYLLHKGDKDIFNDYFKSLTDSLGYSKTFQPSYVAVSATANDLCEYLYNNIEEDVVRHFLELNTPFEDALLVRAYTEDNIVVAHEIIYNGYRNYLEMSTIIILYKFDKELLFELFANMNPLAMHHAKEILNSRAQKFDSETSLFYDNQLCRVLPYYREFAENFSLIKAKFKSLQKGRFSDEE